MRLPRHQTSHPDRRALLIQIVAVQFAACRLELHPQKTKIVYCKDTHRRGTHPHVSFDFLGFEFRPRLAAWRGGLFGVPFLPAASDSALKAIRREIRRWSLQTRTDKALDDLARMFAPYIRGWINYYGQFYKSALAPSLRRIDFHLIKWARHKFKRRSAARQSERFGAIETIGLSSGLTLSDPNIASQGSANDESTYPPDRPPLTRGRPSLEPSDLRSVRWEDIAKLDVHHVGEAYVMEQLVSQYDRETVPAIVLPHDEHQRVPNMKRNVARSDLEQLHADIQNLKDYTSTPEDKVEELIELNRKFYPQVFQT